MAKVTRSALDEVSPEIQMGGLDEVNGLFQTNQFYDEIDTSCCDFWTFHTYEQGISNITPLLLGTVNQLSDYGPVWITEFADTQNGSPDAGMDFSTPAAALGFADMIGKIWGKGFEGFIHFRLSDTFTNQWAGHGLFADSEGINADGEPYALFPSYFVFANLFRELGDGDIVSIDAPEGISSVAARHSDSDQLSVWITNPTPVDTTLGVIVTNYPQTKAQIEIFNNLVSDQPIRSVRVDGEYLAHVITLPENSSFLLVFTP